MGFVLDRDLAGYAPALLPARDRLLDASQARSVVIVDSVMSDIMADWLPTPRSQTTSLISPGDANTA
jgi:hypothetical protein